MKILLNSQIKEVSNIDLDSGYFYGYGAFETILVKAKKAILLDKHIERLNHALNFLEIQKMLTRDDVEYAIKALDCVNIALKINVSEKNIIFSTREISYTKQQYEKGAKLILSKVLRNDTSATVYIKSMNNMDNLLELRKARQSGYQDVLFMNYRDEICETAVANLFIIKDNQLMTPSLNSGLLAGILRQWVIDNYDVKEKKITLDEVFACDGAFITNSLIGIMKVASIEENILKDSPLTHDIFLKYNQFLKETVE